MARSDSLPPGARRLPDGRIKVTVDVPPGPDGARRQRSRIVTTVAQAKTVYAELKSSMDDGSYVHPSNHTVNDQIEGWLLAKARQVKPSTHLGYGVALKPIRRAFGDRPLQSITKADVESAVTAIQDAGRTARTANLTLVTLKAVMQAAVEEGLIKRNPAALVKPSRQTRRDMTTWTPAELATYLAAARDHLWQASIELSCLGLRRGEVVGLRWCDVDLGDTPRITIRATTVSLAGTSTASTPKSERSRRVLPLGEVPSVVAALRETRRAAGLRIRRDPTTPVLVDQWGALVRPELYGDELQRLMVQAGVPKIRVHDIRHTFATQALTRGVPVHLVAQWLGHDPVTCLRTYAHAIPTSLASVPGAVHPLAVGA